MKLWNLTHSRPDHALRTAQRAEAAGWDGLAVVDSQNLAPDSYVALTLEIVVSGPTAGTDREAAREAMALLDEAVVPFA